MISDVNHKIVLFDGLCNLCDRSVNFIILKDKKDRFRFAAIQSAIGQSLVLQYRIDPRRSDSVILIDNNKVFERSSAMLYISKYLSGGYPLLYFFILFPKWIRDGLYLYIAKNRYRWFGKKVSCMTPSIDKRYKFLS